MIKINQKLLDKLGKTQLSQAEQKILNSRWQQFLNFFNFFGLDIDFKTAQKKLTEASLQIKRFLEKNLSPDQIKYLNLRTAIGGTTKQSNSHYILYPPSISDMLETFKLNAEQQENLTKKFSIDLNTILSNILEAKDIKFMPQTKFIKIQNALDSWYRDKIKNAYTQESSKDIFTQQDFDNQFYKEDKLSKGLENEDVLRLGVSHDSKMSEDVALLNLMNDSVQVQTSVNATRQTQHASRYTSAIKNKSCHSR